MSGMLGQILGGVLGGGGGRQQVQPSALQSILQQILGGSGQGSGGQGGGLSDLLSRFQSAGAGEQANSWVGTGANQPVSPDQVGTAFSPEQIQGWADQAGTTPDHMRQVLAEALPHAVDHVTPNGQAPSQNTDIGGMLGNLLGGGRQT